MRHYPKGRDWWAVARRVVKWVAWLAIGLTLCNVLLDSGWLPHMTQDPVWWFLKTLAIGLVAYMVVAGFAYIISDIAKAGTD